MDTKTRTVEQAVRTVTLSKYHRLRPGALLGTLLCGSELPAGPSQWRPVDEVPAETRCQRCFKAGA